MEGGGLHVPLCRLALPSRKVFEINVCHVKVSASSATLIFLYQEKVGFSRWAVRGKASTFLKL